MSTSSFPSRPHRRRCHRPGQESRGASRLSLASAWLILYRIADPGPGFAIDKLPHAAIGQPDDNPIRHMQVREEKGIRPGGFGLVMVRASVDELLYNEQQNEVVFVKYFDEAPRSS
jgi:anti-sigma regulatory factor (Ser/Thr protein kinase)